MKKKHTILIGLGMMSVLSSCMPREVTDVTRIDELKYGIAVKKNEIKNYEFNILFTETRVEKETSSERKAFGSAHMHFNEDGEQQVFVSSEQGENDTLYLVNDETYGKLIYCDYYSYNNGEITVIDYKGHKSEFDSIYSNVFEAPNTIVPTFVDPYKAVTFPERYHYGQSGTFKTEKKYYSNSDGELIIKIDDVSTIEGEDSESHFEIYYEDFTLKKGSFLRKYSDSYSTTTQEYTFNLVEKEKFDIELPAGWERYLIKD